MKAEDRDVYEIIEDKLNLTEKDIDWLFEKNKYFKFMMPVDVLQTMRFFLDFGITIREMRDITLKNPYFLTENFERVRYIEKYLKNVGINDMKWMIINHPISISQNPIEIKEFIEKNRKDGKKDEEIKKILMEEFEKYFSL